MCNFITTLPKKSKTSEIAKPKHLEIYFRPIESDDRSQVYRFRIIAFTKGKRDYPFIEKWIHEVREKDETGKTVNIDSVVCKSTKYVSAFDTTGEKCPICQHVDKLWTLSKESGYRDKLVNRKRNQLQRKYRAHILAYVVNDPTYEGNNGKLRVITLFNKEQYNAFIDLVKRAMAVYGNVFNGNNAVDFWVRPTKEVTSIGKDGTEYSTVKIDGDNWGFSSKCYTLEAITPELVDAFPFDDEFYQYSSNDELHAFYKKYCAGPMIQVPDDDIIPMPTAKKTTVKAAPAPQAQAIKTVAAEKPEISIDLNDIDNILADDPDNVSFDEPVVEEKPARKTKAAKQTVEIDDVDISETTDIDLDKLFDDIDL
jgi:hypothetical protein